MRIPQLAGVVERRLLVNYRVDPEPLRRLLPAPFRPQLVDGAGVAGICLIRLSGLRPRWSPSAFGQTSENAAHRVAVEWDGPDGLTVGVYIPRRDTASRLTTLLGGRLFPGAHTRARFDVTETDSDLKVAYTAVDGAAAVDVHVRVEPELTGSALFTDVEEASRFFERGAVGYSPGRGGTQLEALRLSTKAWRVDPARVVSARSSFFDDPRRFPTGSAQLDCALVMRMVPVVWDTAAAPETART